MVVDARVLVVDLGGSGLRVGLADAHGKLTFLLRQELPLSYSAHHPGAVEFGADIANVVRDAICRAIASADDAERRAITAVVCTSMREGFVLLDSHGNVLYAGPNADYRGIEEAEELERRVGSRLYQATGQWIRPPAGALHAPCRLLWFSRHEPERLSRAAVFMMLSDWVASMFSEEWTSEPTCASSSALFDISTLQWRSDLIESAGASSSIFPAIVRTGDIISKVSSKAGGLAKACGLGPNVAVVAGGADTQHSLLGCGVLGVGKVGIVAGTTSPVQMVINRPLVDPQANTWTSCHVKPGSWVLESNAGRTGFAYSWFASLIQEFSPSLGTEEIYRRIDELAMTSPAGAGGVTFALDPHVMGDSSAGADYRGLIQGIRTAGARRTGAADFARALMENMASAYALNLEQLERVSGTTAGPVTISGGSTQSPSQLQVIAEALRRPIRAARETEATMLGAAISGFAACGVYEGIDVAADRMKSETTEITGDTRNADIYVHHHRRWQELKRLAVELLPRS